MGRHRRADRLRRRIVIALVIALGLPAGLSTIAGASAPQSTDPAAADALELSTDQTAASAVSELSETSRLADRRALVTGDRFYAMSAADGRYPATGWHTRGEMGGFWTPPIKLLDGIWFAADGSWLGPATKTTSGWGYVRSDLPTRNGVRASRLDFVPDGVRASLTGITFTTTRSRELTLTVDAHSELMSAYPWGETTSGQATVNLRDTGAFEDRALVFRDVGTPPGPNQAPHDWAAMVGSALAPTGGRLGSAFRGPQTPPVICPASGPGTPPPPARCDDSAYGNGTGGQLRYVLRLAADRPTTIWFAVAGSDRGVADARSQLNQALESPDTLFARKVATRRDVGTRTAVDLPGDRQLQHSVEWSKQNLADSVQEARGLTLRVTQQAKQYPPPAGTLATARWFGAGFPDYPWLFGTDGEYTAFAAVAAGQFESAKAHLRALRDVSEVVNARSGKVVHEVTPDGSVYFGTDAEAGNTDETAKFPSAVALLWRWTGDDSFRDEMYDFAVRNMRYVTQLDADGDGWPEGLGDVEREGIGEGMGDGMGEEKLDNAVYTIRGLRDLADLAQSRADLTTADWASNRAQALGRRFEQTWWFGQSANQYADSLQGTGDAPVFQRHWIGVTPAEALLTRAGGDRPLASIEHGRKLLARREQPCYTGSNGLFHTGTGPTIASGGNRGPSCDEEASTVQSERAMFSLNTAIMAVAEGNYGRFGRGQQQRYTAANARIQLDPRLWEAPGAMPEIAPGGDFAANIDKPFTDRSMVLQAWGAYGVLWPVVRQQLGVAPDLGRSHVTVVPRIPDGQDEITGHNIRLGTGSVDVNAVRDHKALATTVTRRVLAQLTIGVVVPSDADVHSVRLDGHRAGYTTRRSARGTEILVDVPAGVGVSSLVVRYR